MASTSRIDDVDLQIIDLLMQDGRMSCEEMASRIGDISARAVRYRMNAMIEHKVIHVTAVPDPVALGLHVIADVFIEVEPGLVMDVANRLAAYDNVAYVACSTGDRDITIQVVAQNNAELFTFVSEEVGNIPGVHKTRTNITPIVLKRFDFNVRTVAASARQAAEGD